MKAIYLAALVAVAAVALSVPACAISNISHAPNAACYLDGVTDPAWGKWEFDNPLKGNEHIMGHPIIQPGGWRDAGYNPASGTPYEDWTAQLQGGLINGDPNEIWMRDSTLINQWIETDTVACTIVAISLPADSNDGPCEVAVDGNVVFTANMGSASPQRVIILVKGLANTTHHIEVRDLGGLPGSCDVHCFGAAALGETVSKFDQPPMQTDMGTIYYGWNEKSYYPGTQAAADDWRCTTTDPVKDIHWWGSYVNWKEHAPPAVQPDYFHITIWTDIPGTFSHPGECIWAYDTTAGALTPEFVGWDYDPVTKQIEACFKYNVDLPPANWFTQDPSPNGGIYWLCIQAVYSTGTIDYPWGWKTLPRDDTSPAPDAAVSIDLPVLAQPYLTYWEAGHKLLWDTKSWDLAFELTTTTTVTSTKWQQPPIWEVGGPIPQRIFGWDEKSRYEPVPGQGKQIVADDWMCVNNDPVSDVHWWGSYLGWANEMMPPSTAPDMFHIGVWTDVPKGGTNLFSHPGTMVKEWYVSRGLTNEQYVGEDFHPEYGTESCFKYDFEIPKGEWFYQAGLNTIYWLSIAADYAPQQPTTNLWGWKTRQRESISPAPDGAVRITNPTAPNLGLNKNYIAGSAIKDNQNNLWDTAFYLTSKQDVLSYKWRQPPVPDTAPKIYGWDEKSVYGKEQIVGDDWLCRSHYPVTDIHWWGSFLGWSAADPPQLPDRWQIDIWDDVPVGEKPFSHPGKCIKHITVPKDEVSLVFAGWDIDPRDPNPHLPMIAPEACFKFEVDLRPDQWFYQPRGTDTVYWVTIAADYNAMPANVFGWKTRPHIAGSMPPDDAVRIFNPTAPLMGIPYVNGEPIESAGTSWDVAFELTTIPIGTLTFSNGIPIPNHLWQPGNQSRNNMLSLRLSADGVENISWDSITLKAFGRGNDQWGISSVDVWIDSGPNPGVWDPAPGGDVWIGTGFYGADNGQVTIGISIPPPAGLPLIIAAGGSIPVLITYTMNAGATPGESYYFKVIDASGTGQTSGQTITTPYFVLGLPKASARKVITGLQPITIAAAKKLATGVGFLLQDKFVTGDFTSGMNLFYIEEAANLAAGVSGLGIIGIGVDTTEVAPGAFALGNKTTLYGETALLNGTELVVLPDFVSFAPGYELIPVAVNNKGTGGTAFGSQPGVVDKGVATPPSYGLNTIGKLIRIWGKVRGNGAINIGGGLSQDVWWIDDGTPLHDGFVSGRNGIAVVEPSDWVVAPPADGSYVVAVGVLRAIPNPGGLGVRLLVPRSSTDIQTY